MSKRDSDLLALRPIIAGAKINSQMSAEERFQNETLRPVAKFQNDLLLAVFRNYIAKHKNIFYTITIEKRLNYIENALQKDIKFRNNVKGILVGQFTMMEHESYVNNSSALNKRMMNIVRERLQSQIQLLERKSDEIV